MAAGPAYLSSTTDSVEVKQATASNLKATVIGAGSAGTADAGVLTVQGIASMTPILATLSGTNNIATVSTVTSVSQWAGTAIDVNSGVKSAGTLRVVLATDQPQLTNKLLVTPDANSAINMAQVGGTNTVTGGVNGSQGVGGLAASGASKAGNPLQVGGVFNTTQPTVTTGQAVEAQCTARGAQIVAVGVDGFTVTANAGTGNFANNIAQIGGNTVSSGSGATGNGVIRVTLPTDGDGTIAGITTSIVPGTGATHLGKAEDAAHTSGDVGVMALAVRQDTIGSSTSADGDYGSLKLNSVGRLYTSSTVDAALPAGTNVIGHVIIDSGSTTVVTGTVTVAGGKTNNNAAPGATNVGALVALANAAAPSWTEGNMVALSTDLTGALRTSAGGVAQGSTTSGQSGTLIQGAVTTSAPSYTTAQTSPLSLTTAGLLRVSLGDRLDSTNDSVAIPAGATTIGKAEDSASADGDVGVPAMAVLRATPTDSAGTDGDYQPIQMKGGRIWVDGSGVTLTVGSHNVTNAGTFAVQATVAAAATNIAKAEDVASADADVGVPAMAILKATPADTAGTDGDYQMLQMKNGRLWVDNSGINSTVINAGTFAVQDSQVKAEDAASANADNLFPVGVIRRDTPVANANVSADADYTQLAVDNTQKLWIAGSQKEDDASADGDRGIAQLAVRKATPANTSGTDGDYEFLQMNNGALWTSNLGFFATCTTQITRPADTNAYTANDTWADSTSAPTAGGFTFTSAARKSGGSGIITDAIIVSSNAPGTTLQGEIWIFDSAPTAVNDNAAFALSDADALKYVGKIPFTLAVEATNNSTAWVSGLNMGFTTSGSANLRYLVKVINAYTPASAETLNVRLKCYQID